MSPPAIAKIVRAPLAEVEDVQARADTRRLAVNRVGIRHISHPVRVKDRSAGEQHTIATFNMYVSLPHNFKGTHMSRFVEALHAEREISVESFRSMLSGMTARLEADYGAHNQRSQVTITAKLRSRMWIEELIEIAESEASCELYSILKRPDEKYVTERAYDNPKFVEDMVRDVAAHLNRDERVAAYVVESENFESIHNHSAYALIEHDKDA
jgi:GTP cyclohydrolase I